MKHTLGPLYVGGTYNTDIFSGSDRIASCYSHNIGSTHSTVNYPEAKANTQLFAAAPTLKEKGHALAMLALQSIRYTHNPDFKEAVDDLLAAINKATEKEV